MKALSVKNLNVAFGRNVVLEDISFELDSGVIAAVIGPNGSGKSTLFRAILGLIPYAGEIKIFGDPIKAALPRIGYMPQHFDFDRTMPITVSEFLSFTAPRLRKPKAETICGDVQVDTLKHKLIGELSGGQLQRVMIAQALYKNPDLLLLDEPSSGIDIEGAKAFYELIEHLNTKHKVTVLLISHEVNFVHRFADQIICLNRKLICDGAPAEVLNRETLNKLYGSRMDLHLH
jgi:ABC-type Mn2+/Zn2+ transport system ATPase subunit